MGIDELSVSPGRLLTIRRLICETDSSANKEEILKNGCSAVLQGYVET